MEKNTSSSSSAHVLIIPLPAQGHVTPMLSLAKLLSFSGVFTTFVNTESIHHRLSVSSDLTDRRRLRFRAVPDPLTGGADEELDFSSKFINLQESMRSCSTEAYKKLLLTEELAGEWPPVTCVIADGILDCAIEVAGEVGIPTLVFRSSSPCSAWAYASLRSLMDQGIIPFPGVYLSRAVHERLGVRLDKGSFVFSSYCKRAKLELHFQARLINEPSLSS